MRYYLIKTTLGFFLFMAAFTIISRAVFGITAPQVRTVLPEQKKITHHVSSMGQAMGKQELAVNAPADVKVQRVCVAEGEPIREGKTLFVAEPEELSLTIENLQQELKALQEAGAQSQEEPIRFDQSGKGETPRTESTVEEKTLQRHLQELRDLQARGGRICADGRGLITEVNVKAGDKTTGNGDIRYADASQGLIITARFNEADREYLKKKSSITVETESGASISGLRIRSMAADKEMPGEYLVTVEVSDKKLKIGSMAEIKVESGDTLYDVCIPREALHQSEKGAYYVYVVKEEETLIGRHLTAVRADVAVSDKNEEFAALEDLTAEDEIILEADRELEDGCRIRRLEP